MRFLSLTLRTLGLLWVWLFCAFWPYHVWYWGIFFGALHHDHAMRAMAVEAGWCTVGTLLFCALLYWGDRVVRRPLAKGTAPAWVGWKYIFLSAFLTLAAFCIWAGHQDGKQSAQTLMAQIQQEERLNSLDQPPLDGMDQEAMNAFAANKAITEQAETDALATHFAAAMLDLLFVLPLLLILSCIRFVAGRRLRRMPETAQPPEAQNVPGGGV